MNRKRYVQHFSNAGRKFQVLEDSGFRWHVHLSQLEQDTWLPKSEYILCDPPEEWDDVTDEFYSTEGTYPILRHAKSNSIVHINNGKQMWAPTEMNNTGDLRIKKIDGLHHGPAFIIMQRKS